nr:hypothetical protein Ade03nite_59420 [Actinoplanes derwentensis]
MLFALLLSVASCVSRAVTAASSKIGFPVSTGGADVTAVTAGAGVVFGVQAAAGSRSRNATAILVVRGTGGEDTGCRLE